MKKAKLIISAILLFAAVGAYASSHNLRVQDGYYVDGDVCRFLDEVPCESGISGCFLETPVGNVQIYGSDIETGPELPCSDPLELE